MTSIQIPGLDVWSEVVPGIQKGYVETSDVSGAGWITTTAEVRCEGGEIWGEDNCKSYTWSQKVLWETLRQVWRCTGFSRVFW